MNILVTGADGQLGRMLAKASSISADEYIYTDVRPDAERGILGLDITDSAAVESFLSAGNIDVIVNCASYTAVDKAEEDAEKADLINNIAVASLAECARRHDAVLIHISSDYVFDGKASVPYTEESPLSPLSVYGKTKADSEKAVMASGCRYIIFRTSWLYCLEGKNFVKRILEKSAESPQLKVIFDQVGTPTYAPDLAGMIFHIIENRMLDKTGLYNYSNEGVCSWYDFAAAICRGFGYLCDVRPCRTEDFPSKVRRPSYSVLDKSLFKTTFGCEIPHWEDSLAVAVADYMKLMSNK